MTNASLIIEWCYDDYITITDREDSSDTMERWLKIIELFHGTDNSWLNGEMADNIETLDNELEERL